MIEPAISQRPMSRGSGDRERDQQADEGDGHHEPLRAGLGDDG